MRPSRTVLAVAVGSALGIGIAAGNAYAAPPVAQHPPAAQQRAADAHADVRDVAQDRSALQAQRADIARDRLQRQTDLREMQAAARSHDRAAMLEERGELRRDNLDLRHDRFAVSRTRRDMHRDVQDIHHDREGRFRAGGARHWDRRAALERIGERRQALRTERLRRADEAGELRAAAYDHDRGAMLQDHNGLRRSGFGLDRDQVALDATRTGRAVDPQSGRRDVDARSAAAQQADLRTDAQQADAQRRDLARDQAKRSGDLRELRTAARDHDQPGMLDERSELRRDNVDLRHDRTALKRTRADALRDMDAGTQGANDESDSGARAHRAGPSVADVTEAHALPAGGKSTDDDQ